MLRPKEMVRVLIAGPRDRLSETVEILHDLQVLHIVDFKGEDETFHMGRPLEPASEISESLLKLRSMASVLELEKLKEIEPGDMGPDARQRLATLEINIREEDESRRKMDELLGDLRSKAEAIRPFADLGLELSYYHGYENLEVFVGKLSGDLEGLGEITDKWDAIQARDNIALFVEKGKAEDVRSYLTRRGFTHLEPPAAEGDPTAMLRDVLADARRWETRLRAVEERLTTLRGRFAGFIVAAEEFFSREIEKAEAPLRFATSDHSFIVEGWVPQERWEEVGHRLEEPGTIYVDILEDSEAEEPPVLLDNPKPVRPFELLTNLFSTPSYKEIDPTLTLFVIFPIFFGLMVGDLGYGVTLMVVGLVGLLLVKKSPDMRRFMAIIILAGIATALFGAFLYADAFGIPFQATESHNGEMVAEESGASGAVSWELLLGMEIPLAATVHKLTDIVDLLVLSVVAAFLHLGLGFVLGFFNEVRHDRRHAIAKGAWFVVLFGFFLVLMSRLRWTRVAGYVWGNFLSFIPVEGLQVFGFSIPWVALAMLLSGAGVMAVMEFMTIGNPVAILETAGLLANMISYTRLAGIAVAKAAIADALNNAIFTGLIFDHGVPSLALGLFVLVLAQMMVFLLGGLSAGIQALRLNYVEFFMKFFKGDGLPFAPFGARSLKT